MNNTENLINQFVGGDLAVIPVLPFVNYLILSGVLATILAWFYRRYSSVISDKTSFSYNFIIIAMTTTLVISIIKASLALSLGLVGALSIVRFRGAIKEPEELSYLFLAIAIGLGCGAMQGVVTSIAVTLVLLAIFIRFKLMSGGAKKSNVYLNIASDKNVDVEQVSSILAANFEAVKLQRYDIAQNATEISYFCAIRNIEAMNKARLELAKIDKGIRLSFHES